MTVLILETLGTFANFETYTLAQLGGLTDISDACDHKRNSKLKYSGR